MPTWKHAERRIAAITGGTRVGNQGRHVGAEDVAHDRLSLECKHRAALPTWLHEAMRQAERNAPTGKLAVAVLHESGQRYDDSLVVIRLSELVKLVNAQE
jgi:hypothetical protein